MKLEKHELAFMAAVAYTDMALHKKLEILNRYFALVDRTPLTSESHKILFSHLKEKEKNGIK